MSEATIIFLRAANAIPASPTHADDIRAISLGKIPHDLEGMISEGLAEITDNHIELTAIGERALRYLRLATPL